MRERERLTHSQQLTENIQNIQSGLDIPVVLSKPQKVDLLNNINVYMLNYRHLRHLCNYLFFLQGYTKACMHFLCHRMQCLKQ